MFEIYRCLNKMSVRSKEKCVREKMARGWIKGIASFHSFRFDTFHNPGNSNFSWQSLSGVASLWMLRHDIVIYRVYAQQLNYKNKSHKTSTCFK